MTATEVLTVVIEIVEDQRLKIAPMALTMIAMALRTAMILTVQVVQRVVPALILTETVTTARAVVVPVRIVMTRAHLCILAQQNLALTAATMTVTGGRIVVTLIARAVQHVQAAAVVVHLVPQSLAPPHVEPEALGHVHPLVHGTLVGRLKFVTTAMTTLTLTLMTVLVGTVPDLIVQLLVKPALWARGLTVFAFNLLFLTFIN